MSEVWAFLFLLSFFRQKIYDSRPNPAKKKCPSILHIFYIVKDQTSSHSEQNHTYIYNGNQILCPEGGAHYAVKRASDLNSKAPIP